MNANPPRVPGATASQGGARKVAVPLYRLPVISNRTELASFKRKQDILVVVAGRWPDIKDLCIVYNEEKAARLRAAVVAFDTAAFQPCRNWHKVLDLKVPVTGPLVVLFRNGRRVTPSMRPGVTGIEPRHVTIGRKQRVDAGFLMGKVASMEMPSRGVPWRGIDNDSVVNCRDREAGPFGRPRNDVPDAFDRDWYDTCWDWWDGGLVNGASTPPAGAGGGR